MEEKTHPLPLPTLAFTNAFGTKMCFFSQAAYAVNQHVSIYTEDILFLVRFFPIDDSSHLPW